MVWCCQQTGYIQQQLDSQDNRVDSKGRSTVSWTLKTWGLIHSVQPSGFVSAMLHLGHPRLLGSHSGGRQTYDVPFLLWSLWLHVVWCLLPCLYYSSWHSPVIAEVLVAWWTSTWHPTGGCPVQYDAWVGYSKGFYVFQVSSYITNTFWHSLPLRLAPRIFRAAETVPGPWNKETTGGVPTGS